MSDTTSTQPAALPPAPNEFEPSEGQLGRAIKLFVVKVSREIPDPPPKFKEKRTSKRLVEMSKQDAIKLCNILKKQLDSGIPGGVGFVLYGYEEL